METVPVTQVSLTGNVMLYGQPELLSKEVHGKLGVNPAPTRFSFAASAHMCPLTVPEFGPASLSYPVIFVGEDLQPVAVMGLQEGQNLFATPETGYEADAYVACYIRRYPFVLATGEVSEGSEERMLVGIDRSYKYLAEDAQFPFFVDGEPTEYTKNCIQFCNDFETQNRMTKSFIALLKELDLIEPRSATYQPMGADGVAGETQTIATFQAVSEEKLKALPAKKLAEMRDSGALMQIYAHLNSQFGWERLIMRAIERTTAEQAAAANNA